MTTMTKTQAPTITTPASSPRGGFNTIPTRIRDVRDTQVPTLVVQPMAEQDKALVRQSLAELGTKLAETAYSHSAVIELARAAFGKGDQF